MPYIARCAEINVLVSFQKPVYCRQWNYQIKKIYVRTSHLTQAWSKEMCRFFSKTFSWIGLVDLEQQFYVIIFPQKIIKLRTISKFWKETKILIFAHLCCSDWFCWLKESLKYTFELSLAIGIFALNCLRCFSIQMLDHLQLKVFHELHSVLKVPISAHFPDWHRNRLGLIGWGHIPTRFILP